MLSSKQKDKNKDIAVTLMILSGESGYPKRITIAQSTIRIFIGFSIVIGLLVSAIVIDYFGLLSVSIENHKLMAQNTLYQAQFKEVESRLEKLQSSFDRLNNFTSKLKLIANIKDDQIKNTSNNQQIVPLQDRESFEGQLTQDEVFKQEKPIQEEIGELISLDSNKDYKTLAIRIEETLVRSQLKEQSMTELWQLLSDRQSLLMSTPNIKPANGYYSSGFGYRSSPFGGKSAFHAGLDIAAPPGSPVYAPGDGVISWVGFDESYGKLISIDHGFNITTRFGHLSQTYVQLGQKVNRWDVIGAVGNTGRSTGPHLHYEVRVNGVPRDPSAYILDDL